MTDVSKITLIDVNQKNPNWCRLKQARVDVGQKDLTGVGQKILAYINQKNPNQRRLKNNIG